jgi:hypothetical protein
MSYSAAGGVRHQSVEKYPNVFRSNSQMRLQSRISTLIDSAKRVQRHADQFFFPLIFTETFSPHLGHTAV